MQRCSDERAAAASKKQKKLKGIDGALSEPLIELQLRFCLRELGADIILYALTTELDRTPARERNDSGDGTLLLFACFRHFPILKSLVSLYLVLRNSFERQQLRQQVGVGHGVCEEELGE